MPRPAPPPPLQHSTAQYSLVQPTRAQFSPVQRLGEPKCKTFRYPATFFECLKVNGAIIKGIFRQSSDHLLSENYELQLIDIIW